MDDLIYAEFQPAAVTEHEDPNGNEAPPDVHQEASENSASDDDDLLNWSSDEEPAPSKPAGQFTAGDEVLYRPYPNQQETGPYFVIKQKDPTTFVIARLLRIGGKQILDAQREQIRHCSKWEALEAHFRHQRTGQ